MKIQLGTKPLWKILPGLTSLGMLFTLQLVAWQITTPSALCAQGEYPDMDVSDDDDFAYVAGSDAPASDITNIAEDGNMIAPISGGSHFYANTNYMLDTSTGDILTTENDYSNIYEDADAFAYATAMRSSEDLLPPSSGTTHELTIPLQKELKNPNPYVYQLPIGEEKQKIPTMSELLRGKSSLDQPNEQAAQPIATYIFTDGSLKSFGAQTGLQTPGMGSSDNNTALLESACLEIQKKLPQTQYVEISKISRDAKGNILVEYNAFPPTGPMTKGNIVYPQKTVGWVDT